ncbi:MAG TPA: flagellar basal-body rod protein FlgG [Lichenihabitans sp.]|jgi:flagellar basal-body rod protein FlgG|nr:flagellar basal-body rod protein FlgG [Lichenihabitans sp.]
MRALAIAATGMSAQQTNVEVIANNLANINTTGFKRGKAEFSDLLYEAQRANGVSSRGNANTIPEGAQLGLGVKLVAVRSLQTQGTLAQTGNTFDLALQGNGWFQVTSPSGETLYTRAGAFNINGSGQLVTLDGNLVSPAIIIPPNTSNVVISQSGIVSGTVAGAQTPTQFGQLTIAMFANDAGLEHLGDNLFRESPASGTPVVGVPADPGYATISQGYLEASNVDPVKEITDLISAQRAYEMNSKVIQAADQMGDTLSKGIR